MGKEEITLRQLLDALSLNTEMTVPKVDEDGHQSRKVYRMSSNLHLILQTTTGMSVVIRGLDDYKRLLFKIVVGWELKVTDVVTERHELVVVISHVGPEFETVANSSFLS